MSWNYRIVKYKDGGGYGLHEVYYDKDGLAWAMTEKPVGFVCDVDEDPKESIGEQLLMAKTNARMRPIFEEPDEWPGKNPADQETES